jgi:hypothetical protein
MKFASSLAYPIQPRGISREPRCLSFAAHNHSPNTFQSQVPSFPFDSTGCVTLPTPIGSPERQNSLRVAINRVSPSEYPQSVIIPLFPGSVRLEQSPIPMFPLRDSQHLFQYTGGESWRSKQCRLPGTTMANTSFASWKPRLPCLVLFRLPIGGYH